MGLNNIVKSRGFKNFMAKLYGWGASVVILGALFKINHYPGAEYMLIVGLGTEAIIFFFSGFEPPHVEPDWSLVYPELAGMYHGITPEIEGDNGYNGRKGTSNELDKMLEEAKIGPELIDSLGKGLRNLSDSASKLSSVSDAAVATNDFTKNIKNATSTVGELNESYKKTAETLQKEASAGEEYYTNMKSVSASASNLSTAYNKASESLKKDLSAADDFAGSLKNAVDSANKFADKYTKSAEILSKSAEALDFSSIKDNNYIQQLQKLSHNLSALNTSYEVQLQNSKTQADASQKFLDALEKFASNINKSTDHHTKYQDNLSALNNVFQQQLTGTSKQMDSVNKLRETLDDFLGKVGDSAQKTLKYNQELENLAKKVTELNKVYGNMLSAMNVKVD